MNSLMLAIQTIALLCGPRVQTSSTGAISNSARNDTKACQVQMVKCVQSKVASQTGMGKDYEQPLAQCMQEIQ